MAFDLERFIDDCRAANAGTDPERAIGALVREAVADPAALIAALGTPERAALVRLHHEPGLTILNVIWGPRMVITPHNHNMWASIGVYSGREDNIFWRRVPGERGATLEAAGARSLGVRDTVPLGRDIIHSVTNPVSKLTGALHIYRGDLFAAERSEWEPENLTEHPCDSARTIRRFEESNRVPAET